MAWLEDGGVAEGAKKVFVGGGGGGGLAVGQKRCGKVAADGIIIKKKKKKRAPLPCKLENICFFGLLLGKFILKSWELQKATDCVPHPNTP